MKLTEQNRTNLKTKDCFKGHRSYRIFSKMYISLSLDKIGFLIVTIIFQKIEKKTLLTLNIVR
ncbi:MAG: hypothetical protein BTN85_1041 [Candidatus Methanohalarchaeum thermophilum]|uniref:Uncharacterized protein n=1 Tax=Methanohalarchaeum thermophilum TaxID=1903181 RepID=A0A1Q6DW02_METT1|nr:MAG: hypothetical protein BTN85_1041 [Candidatus Methanohalarchaeum thermophilum]